MKNSKKIIEHLRRNVLANTNEQLEMLDKLEYAIDMSLSPKEIKTTYARKETPTYKDFDMDTYLKSYSNQNYSNEINKIHNLLLDKYGINIAKYNIK